MIIVHMLARFKSFLLSIIALFRRALCCFSRRRKPSYAECEILTSVNVVHTNNHHGNRSHDEVCMIYNFKCIKFEINTKYFEQFVL